MAAPVLEVQGLYAAYGQADVLTDINLTVPQGAITCLLGSNGAGKTTLIRAILGLTPPRAGRVVFEGADITGQPTHRVIRRGIASIPEGRKVFSGMTVDENLRLGAFTISDKAEVEQRLARVYEVFPRLAERAAQLAGTMSGGEQAMVSIGRGMMSAPRLMIIDEPSLGLSPLLVKDNFRIIEEINRQGVTIFLVEQNVRQTLAISHHGYVLSGGRLMASGSADELRDNEEVRTAYFG